MSKNSQYSIQDLQFQFASWCAARAVASPRGSITNEAVLTAVEAVGLRQYVGDPTLLPGPRLYDSWHRNLRLSILRVLDAQGYTKSHGIAAKIINIFFKTIYCHPSTCHHPRVSAMHPPIDSEIVGRIHGFGVGDDTLWRDVKWMNLTSDEYEALIADIRVRAKGRPLWHVEQLWRGRTASRN